MGELVCNVNNIFKYLNKLPPLRMDHRLSHGKSEITDFELTNEWRKHLLFQGFNSTSKSLNKFVEFYDRLDVVKYIFEDK